MSTRSFVRPTPKPLTLTLTLSSAIAEAFPSRPRACTVPLGNNDVYPGYHVNNSNRLEYGWQAAVARKYCGIDAEMADQFTRYG